MDVGTVELLWLRLLHHPHFEHGEKRGNRG